MVGLGRSWQTADRRKPSCPGVRTVRLPGLQRAPLRVICLPPGCFSSQIGLNLWRCLWKALPKVSKNSTQLRLSLTHTPSGHKEEASFCGESRRTASQLGGWGWGWEAPGKSMCLGTKALPPPSPHPSKTSDSHTLTSSQ